MLDNLSFRLKLTLIALVASIPGFVLLFLLNREMNISINFAQKEIYGNAYLRPLRKAQEFQQPVREEIERVRLAKEEQSARLESLMKQMDGALDELKAVDARLLRVLEIPNDITELVTRWSSIKGGATIVPDAELEKRFADFNAQLRLVISAVGDKSNLILDPDLDSYYMMDATLLRLPEIQDLLLQARRKGLEVIRQGSIPAEDATALTVLKGLITTQAEGLTRGMGVGFRNNRAENLQDALQSKLDAAGVATSRLTELIQSKMLRTGLEGVTEELFIRLADEAAQRNFALWDASVDMLDVLLRQRIQGFEQRKSYAFASVILLLAFSGVIVFAISARESTRLKQLSAVAAQIATTPELDTKQQRSLEGLISRDEVGSLASRVNAMATQLRDFIAKLRLTADELEASNESLERRVEERTAQLREKNEEIEATLGSLKEAQKRLIVQEKMASLGSLTAGIAHEIKNPLNFVNNFAQLSGELLDEVQELLEDPGVVIPDSIRPDVEGILGDLKMNVTKINEHGKRADGIVKGMLNHSRGKSGEMQPTDLNGMVKEFANLAYHGLRAKDSTFNVTFDAEYDSSIGQVMVVPQDLSRVILNLVNNACQASHTRKKAEGAAFSPILTLRTKNLGDQIEIRVRDNGTGIKKEHMSRLFEPFFTTKPTGEGTGLGLSLSYEIVVEEHGGEFRAESEEGKFAEFIVTIPHKKVKA